MIKFPSINQYRNAIKHVVDRARWVGKEEDGTPIFNQAADLPKLKYRGTVKLHGTNSAIVHTTGSKEYELQSRERVLTLTSDNAGFALYMYSKTFVLDKLFDSIRGLFDYELSKIAVFGEWCGGNIQSGVAISGLPKMFVIFAVKVFKASDNVDDEEHGKWIDIERIKNVEFPTDHIYNVLRFGQWDMEIDFARPEITQNDMIDITMAIEAECPVGKHFEKIGVGEGAVWQCVEEGWRSSDNWFKVKGDQHSSSKVKKLASVDIEVVKAIEDFVELAITESRLEQGLHNLINEQLKPFDMTSMGDYIRWVYNDALKEEADTVIASQLDPKKLGGPIANKARKWFIEKYNTSAMT